MSVQIRNIKPDWSECGTIADEVFGTVFGKQYRYVQASFDIL